MLVCSFHPGACRLLYSLALLLVFSLCILRWTTTLVELDSNPDCEIGLKNLVDGIAQSLACTRKIGNRTGSEGLQSFNSPKETNLLILIILA